jgi:hypothetical protein
VIANSQQLSANSLSILILVLSFCKDSNYYGNDMQEKEKSCNTVAENQYSLPVATRLQQCFPTFAAEINKK